MLTASFASLPDRLVRCRSVLGDSPIIVASLDPLKVSIEPATYAWHFRG